jgi:acetyl esterase/lipase
MSDPRQPAIEPKDRKLSLEPLAYCGRCYAGDLDVKDPQVSPLYGDLAGLAPIAVFVGTHDVLSIDALRLAELAKEKGTTVQLTEQPKMQHVYPILPFLPEARAAQREIVGLVRG